MTGGTVAYLFVLNHLLSRIPTPTCYSKYPTCWCRSLTGKRLHTWQGMIGYCMKDQHKPHFVMHMKGITQEEVDAVRIAAATALTRACTCTCMCHACGCRCSCSAESARCTRPRSGAGCSTTPPTATPLTPPGHTVNVRPSVLHNRTRASASHAGPSPCNYNPAGTLGFCA